MQFLRNLYTKPPDWKQDSILDLTEVSFATPIVCVIRKIYHLKKWSIIEPSNIDVNSYLSWMDCGWQATSQYVPTYQFQIPSIAHKNILRDIRILLEDSVKEDVLKDLSYTLAELVDNVFDHAKSNLGVLVQAQKYPSMRKVEICIADTGRGIDQSMKDNPAYQYLTAEERFEAALKLYHTCKPDQHSGEGLSSVIAWIVENAKSGAEGIIFSNKHVWFCVQTSNQARIGVDHTKYCIWPGTLIWLSIPFLRHVSFVDVWRKLGLGEE